MGLNETLTLPFLLILRETVMPVWRLTDQIQKDLVKKMTDEKTIAGIATAATLTSISVIRISGAEALGSVGRIFRGVDGRPLEDIRPFTIRYGHILEEDGHTIDEVLVSYFKGPKSYTGEDVVEVSCHGGPLPVRRILEKILDQGIRLAEPGEFTKRAFLNGRIDLSQAEAVMDIIQSRTDAALRSANDQSRGRLSGQISQLRDQLMNVMAEIEVTLDFPDDELDRSSDLKLAEKLEDVHEAIHGLIRSAEKGKLLREGLNVVIAGKPNVGKSSLLNALLNEQRAIVTEIPGTTRDLIEEFVNLDGIPLRLTDTAGIRDTEDVVESIGVERSRQSIETADLIILVLDLSQPLTIEDHELIELTSDRRRILLLNKEDLPKAWPVPEDLQKEATVISALNHFGLDQLKNRIREITTMDGAGFDETLITSTRHRDALQKASAALEEAVTAIRSGIPMDIVTIDVNSAWQALGEITGDTLQDDLVDRIFSGFCIGK